MNAPPDCGREAEIGGEHALRGVELDPGSAAVEDVRDQEEAEQQAREAERAAVEDQVGVAQVLAK